MRKIVAGLFISLDGVVESPDQWQFPYFNDEMAAAVDGLIAEGDTMLLGRRTYEEFAAYWPHQDAADPNVAQMNATPKLVVSRTLETAEWQNTTLIKGDLAAELARLKAQPGKNINITGSGTLVRALLRDGLLDELVLLVHPLVVGTGKKLFDGDEQIPLTLTDSKTFGTGVLALTYTPAARA